MKSAAGMCIYICTNTYTHACVQANKNTYAHTQTCMYNSKVLKNKFYLDKEINKCQKCK